MQNTIFSHEKVVIMQLSENSWFYPPVYAKWLVLTRNITREVVCLINGIYLQKNE